MTQQEDMLCGTRIRLRPLQMTDAADLVRAASDGALWQLNVTEVPSADTVAAYIGKALQGRDSGSVMPFAIVLQTSGQVIGTTRFWQISPHHRRLEIGGTWLAASWQRTFANTETKYLMLQHAFERMQCVRVQLTTDVLNEASRRAILRLGATQEGILRNERIMPDGRKRDSVVYSILDDEWPAIKQQLATRLGLNLLP
ncbi:GNAT family N-acetyltransferase [Leeia oryzae]|uniref:GNAT family N-acetyltransferase n=1 Tax=Leeia oryzae TaxID=356662 RepID=UPI00037B01D2|nr:GNAT family protein [Leeia oryzae]